MHIGNYLKQKVKEKRFSVAEIGQKVAKTDTSVRKDFEKEALHMSVVDSYAEVLGINIYELLAQEWAERHGQEPVSSTAASPPQEPYGKPAATKKQDEVQVTLTLRGTKKDKILKILFDEK